MPKHAAFLRANSEAYEWLVERIHTIDRRREPETVLRQIVAAARFAAVFHVGRFADGNIENLALDIGTELEEIPIAASDNRHSVLHKQGRRRVLHVATDILGVGGHTRMLYHWIRHDNNSCHSLVLVNQRNLAAMPNWLSEAIQFSGGELVVFPAESELCQKARWLREIANRIADLVVLHHCPFDVVPTVAFAVRGGPPVAILNHADHLFWLGSSVADFVINLRTPASVHTAERRFVDNNIVIPIPLIDSAQHKSRSEARQDLGISDDECMLLTIGRGEKFRPCGRYDFVATANKILDFQPEAHLYIVGESESGIAPYLKCALHKRLHFIGSIDDPKPYLLAADIFLESFPYGSNTSLLEAALSGLPVVPAYAPLFTLLVANNDALSNIFFNPSNETDYIDTAIKFIRSLDQRVKFGALLRNQLLLDHTGEGWLSALSEIYRQTDDLIHNPHPIPIASCGMTNADIGLGLWHVVTDGKNISTGFLKNQRSALSCHASFVAKEVGHYRLARKHAWSVLRQDPFKWLSWRLIGVSLLGKMGRFIRQLQGLG